MSPADPLERLIAAWLQGTIAPADFAALDRRLREDPAARRALRRAANLDAALREWATRDPKGAAWLAHPEAPPRRPHWRWQLPLGLAAAAALCFTAYRVGTRTSAPAVAAEQTSRGAAILTQAVDAAWSGAATRPRVGDSLAAGPLALGAGFAQIEFFSGATLLIEGPAEFEIESAWRVAWRHGRARVRVPPAARGFELLTPQMKLVDLGTEFGVEVDRTTAGARVQVFSGEVEAHPPAAAQLKLLEGQGLEQRGPSVARVAAALPVDFVSGERLRDLGRARADSNFARWEAFSRAQRRDPRLLAYYAIQRDATADRLVRNLAEPGEPLRDGGAVGASWSQGRWPQKDALEFKRPGDRVRLEVGGQYRAVTLACWVRIDGLDRTLNGLFLTDGFEPGEPHWQIHRDGKIRFAIAYPNPAATEGGTEPRLSRFVYESPVVVGQPQTGRWRHLAVTYDGTTGTGIHYVDGAVVSRATHASHNVNQPVVFGPAEIGNWGLPIEIYGFRIRNLNGRIDEFAIFGAALGAAEIAAMAEAGRPD